MVGIVIVSHSEKLAAGVQELAQQMAQGAVRSTMDANAPRFAIAAGIDDPENPFGTDAVQIYQAIESVYSDEGVVVLMDLGSAILSAELALEFLSEEQRAKVRLCEAPLVEGAIAAVVQAASGADIEQVIAEAKGALAAKAAQLFGIETPPTAPLLNPENAQQPITNNQQPTTEIHLIVKNQMGLHARPAAKFVATASRFQSQITLKNLTSANQSVNAKSINQVITSSVRQGDEIAIAATGTDATEALAALQQLVEANFGESASETLPTTSLPKTSTLINAQLSGIPASSGIAIGKIVRYQSAAIEITLHQAENPQSEWQHLQKACSTARQQIQILREKAATRSEEEAAIFEAHLLFLDDPEVIEQVRQLIFNQYLSAAAAWQALVNETIATFQALNDSYLQARAADVSDVGQRVLQLLTGTKVAALDLQEPTILVATDLTPSQTAQLDPSQVLGICTAEGSAMSHSGILARSLGIPAVVGVGAELLLLKNGTLIALDGETGQVWVEPNDTQLHELQLKRDKQQTSLQTLRATVQQPAITCDG
ncbi:MAG: HPr family phosphocarrier protein, partial [Microcoleus sp. SIO2G3]|nr:HPr family phosphocarrier protein [Microcoleus sp. SIO2G3]